MSELREQMSDDTAVTEVEVGEDLAAERTGRGTRVRGTSSRPDAEPAGDDGEPAAEAAGSAPMGDAPASADAADIGDAEDSADADDDSESTLEGEAEIAADYLEELLDIADLDGDIDTFIEGGRAHVSIVTESNVLVGAGGEVLDALQELTRLAVMTETGDRSRLMLDVAGFRDRRRQELIALAAAAVAEARTKNAPVPLTSMNPFERKIVHDAVAAAGLTSESEGDEPGRHVVVQPQG